MYFAIIRHFQNQNTDIQPYRSNDKQGRQSDGKILRYFAVTPYHSFAGICIIRILKYRQMLSTFYNFTTL